jgi:alpha-D-ribose 1-methylphosphonate 5-triphosphate synthase subunit PhnH
MTKVDVPSFDLVHDTTSVYRTLLDAMARPGTVGQLSVFADGLSLPDDGERVALALALTLLDQRTRFTLRMKEGARLAEAIRRQTFAREAHPGEADYVFVDGDLDDEALYDLLQQTNVGTLLQPENGATVIVRAARIGVCAATDKDALLLSGPGIRGRIACAIEGLSRSWVRERERKNAEYPLGIDLIVYDGDGNMVAIPRTTQLKEGHAS